MIGLFQHLTACAAVGSLYSGVFFLLRHSTRQILGPVHQYRLWILLLILWVLPMRFALHVSVYENTMHDITSESFATYITDKDTGLPRYENIPSDTISVIIEQRESEKGIPFLPILQYIWGIGIVVFGAKQFIPYVYFRRILKKTAFHCDSVQSPLPVYRSFAVHSPMVVGLFRPVLYLPEEYYAEEELACILRHELTHVRRGDIPLKWFAAVVRCLYWWNPLVHLTIHQFAEECEISCDFTAAAGMSEKQRKIYMNLLLRLAEKNCLKTEFLTTGFTDSKAFLKRRLLMIQNEKKQKWMVVFLSSLLLVGLSAGLIYAGGIVRDTVLPAETDTQEEIPTVNSLPEAETDSATDNYEKTLADLKDTLEELRTEAQEVIGENNEMVFTDNNTDIPVIIKPDRNITVSYGFHRESWQNEQHFHRGVDFTGTEGESLSSASKGEITYMEYSPSYGNMIMVTSGAYVICYAHLAEFTPGLAVGDTVEIGTTLGTIGHTGEATGPHLHFEILLNNQPIDPASVWVD